MPLSHPPGEAQFDFGYALARVAGKLRKVAFMVMVLPYSDAISVMAFERECTETFWEGHVQAFEFFGGVPTTRSSMTIRRWRWRRSWAGARSGG